MTFLSVESVSVQSQFSYFSQMYLFVLNIFYVNCIYRNQFI